MTRGRLFDELCDIMLLLRSKNGCPWDRKQNHRSLRPYLIEESYEVLDAIDRRNDDDLKEELGDLLLQIVFHAELAAERKKFTIQDVISYINHKLVERHPHVFAKRKVRGIKEVLKNWEEIKQSTTNKGLFDGIPKSLPALLKTYRMAEKAEHVGWKHPDDSDLKKEIKTLTDGMFVSGMRRDKMEKLLGRAIFLIILYGRKRHIDAENALRHENDKFEKILGHRHHQESSST